MREPEVHQGIRAIAHGNGVAFGVWAPHAEAVLVAGTFNDWSEEATPLDAEEGGYWYTDVAEAKPGDEYRFLIRTGERLLSRIDPYARAVTTRSATASWWRLRRTARMPSSRRRR